MGLRQGPKKLPLEFVVLEKNSSCHFDSGAVFNCDAPGCDTRRQYGAVDGFCELDVGDSKGDQRTGGWTITYATADAERKLVDLGTREM